jgi:hypothetical protein
MSSRSLLPDDEPVALVDVGNEGNHLEISVVATQDHELIRRWAKQRGAEPATGEATESGPSTVDVRDGSVGIRFNFPGSGRYRPISWEEWLEHFSRYDLVFVYERTTQGKTPSGRYRLLQLESLRKKVADVVDDTKP